MRLGEFEALASDPETDLSFESWYASNAGRLLRALTVFARDSTEAEDVLAESCQRAWQRWDSIRNPGAWVFRVATNELNRTRRALSRVSPGSVHRAGVDQYSDPTIWKAVAQLSMRQREVIALRYLADMTEDQVASTLGISTGATSAHLTRARTRLRDLLEELDSTTGGDE